MHTLEQPCVISCCYEDCRCLRKMQTIHTLDITFAFHNFNTNVQNNGKFKGDRSSNAAFDITVKPVLGGLSKIDKTKVLNTNGSLMKAESIAAFCNTFDLHSSIIGLENQFLVFFLSSHLRQVLLYTISNFKIHFVLLNEVTLM